MCLFLFKYLQNDYEGCLTCLWIRTDVETGFVLSDFINISTDNQTDGKMLKSSFPFCDSDQIAMFSHNVQTSLLRFFRRDDAIWVDTINKIQKRNNKLYIMEESSHTWLKYTSRPKQCTEAHIYSNTHRNKIINGR
jgi:hypothetical protein